MSTSGCGVGRTLVGSHCIVLPPPSPSALQSPRRAVGSSFLSDRSPVISPEQSTRIVTALQGIGLLDSGGQLQGNPHDYNKVRGNEAGQEDVATEAAQALRGAGWPCFGVRLRALRLLMLSVAAGASDLPVKQRIGREGGRLSWAACSEWCSAYKQCAGCSAERRPAHRLACCPCAQPSHTPAPDPPRAAGRGLQGVEVAHQAEAGAAMAGQGAPGPHPAQRTHLPGPRGGLRRARARLRWGPQPPMGLPAPPAPAPSAHALRLRCTLHVAAQRRAAGASPTRRLLA